MSKQPVMKFMFAVAQVTEICRAVLRERMDALDNQAEQTWTSHQVTLLDEMDGVAGDALESHGRSLLNEATTERQRHQRQGHEHLLECQQGARRFLSEVQQKVQIPQVTSRKEVETLRHELSQSLAEGSHQQNMYTTSRCVPKFLRNTAGATRT